VEPHPHLACDDDLIVHLAAIGEDVGVVEDGGAAGEDQLGQAGLGRHPHGFGRHPRPHRVERVQPVEDVPILGGRHDAEEGLIEVMVGVHQAGQDDVPVEVEDLVGSLGEFGGRADLLDLAVTDEETAARDLATSCVHGGEDHGVLDEHRPGPRGPGLRRFVLGG
jgi:hypothetical protein